MALVKCPDCGRDVSNAAPACPGCGRPIDAAVSSQAEPASASASSLEDRSAEPLDLGFVAEIAAKIAIGLSVGCYAFGFVITVAHYARLGVPLHALSSETYLAAGIGCLVIGAACWMFGAAWITRLADAFATGKWFRGLVASLALTFIVGISWLGSIFRVTSHSLLFLVPCFVFGAVNGLPKARRLVLNWDTLVYGAWSGLWYLAMTLIIVGFYTEHVYPNVPRHLGGARPMLLASFNSEEAIAPSPELGPLATIRCERPLVKGAHCRRVFLAHESAEHLYLIVEETAGACEPIVDPKRPPTPDLEAASTCFVRIAQSSINHVEVPAKP
jgi:hypothetical protein